VMEHVGKQNVDIFLQHFLECGSQTAKYYLSTPNYDPVVGAAGNHTYDSGDGRGVAVQEFTHEEIQTHVLKYFDIERKWGTFASQKDYKPLLEGWKLEMYNGLKEYYDSNIVANIMAPFFPEHARNTLWELRRKAIPTF